VRCNVFDVQRFVQDGLGAFHAQIDVLLGIVRAQHVERDVVFLLIVLIIVFIDFLGLYDFLTQLLSGLLHLLIQLDFLRENGISIEGVEHLLSELLFA